MRKKFEDFVKLELSIKPRDSDSKNGQIPTQLHLCRHLCLDLHLFSIINPHVAAALLGLTGVSHTHLLCEWDLMLMELPLL